jgi:hypothetical protein
VALKTRNKKKSTVSASELGQMEVCERLVFFEATCGKRKSRCQLAAIDRGKKEHATFFRDGVRLRPGVQTNLSKSWCFCASLAWGPEAPETELLRKFRDRILRRSAAGRRLIRLYYRTAPGLCGLLEGHRKLISALRLGLRPVLWIAKAVLTIEKDGER